MLLVFGGLAGLEVTIEADGALGLSAEEAGDAFDHWINVCPNQGSRTIRTEVSIPILSGCPCVLTVDAILGSSDDSLVAAQTSHRRKRGESLGLFRVNCECKGGESVCKHFWSAGRLHCACPEL